MNFNMMKEERDTGALRSALHEREVQIALLEKELIETKIQLANAETSKDHLNLELSKSAAFTRAIQASCPKCPDEMYGSIYNNDEVIMRTRDSVSSNKRHNQRVMVKVHSRNRMQAKVLRPSSCASGIALLGGIEPTSTISTNSPVIFSRRRRSDASCASMFGQARLSSMGSSASFARRQNLTSTNNHKNADWDLSNLTGPQGNMFLRN